MPKADLRSTRVANRGERSHLPNETEELDRLVAAGTLRAIDREHVRFSVRRIVHPPERADDPLPENVVGSA